MKVLKPVLITLLVLAVLAGSGVFAWNHLRPTIEIENPVTTRAETDINEVVRSIRREKKVVLLNLGVQGTTERSNTRQVWGRDVPGTRRTTMIQYTYDALLGVEGKDVTVRKTGPQAVQVTVPDFIFIGHDNAQFKVASEKNGVISWVTPEVDQPVAITEVLNSGTKARHVADNRDQLEQQAKEFYGGIIKGVDPEVTVTYRFAPSA